VAQLQQNIVNSITKQLQSIAVPARLWSDVVKLVNQRRDYEEVRAAVLKMERGKPTSSSRIAGHLDVRISLGNTIKEQCNRAHQCAGTYSSPVHDRPVFLKIAGDRVLAP
jgi:hypothetical protein